MFKKNINPMQRRKQLFWIYNCFAQNKAKLETMNTAGLQDLFWLMMLLGSTALMSTFVVLAQLHFLLHFDKTSFGAIKTEICLYTCSFTDEQIGISDKQMWAVVNL